MSGKSHIPNYIFFLGLNLLLLLVLIAPKVHPDKSYSVIGVQEKMKLLYGKDTLKGFERYKEISVIPGNKYLILEDINNQYAVLDVQKRPIIEFGKGEIYAVNDMDKGYFTGLFFRRVSSENYQLYGEEGKFIDSFKNIGLTGADNRILIRAFDTKVGFIDYAGTVKIKPLYYFFEDEDIASKYCHFSDYLCPVLNEKGKYGFIDTLGNNITGFKYDLAFPFDNSIAEVYANGYAGFVNIKGEELAFRKMSKK